MTVHEIVIEKLRELGADGLCIPGLECGCGIDDLSPCNCMVGDCIAARLVPCDTGEMDQWYVPLDAPGPR